MDKELGSIRSNKLVLLMITVVGLALTSPSAVARDGKSQTARYENPFFKVKV